MPTLGSLFDGIGGFPLAAVRNGIEPVWASEIEAFPIEVTRKRFPSILHVGDITKLNGAELPPVDIITGGSPCQDLSVAGARAGLAGERSGLFIQAIQDAGLPLPGKSSCFFCPSMKRWEIRTLYHRYPDLLRRALAIEDAAMPNLTSVRGLGRNWAWRDFICADENQLAIPGAFSDEDLPCSCCMKGELPTADL